MLVELAHHVGRKVNLFVLDNFVAFLFDFLQNVRLLVGLVRLDDGDGERFLGGHFGFNLIFNREYSIYINIEIYTQFLHALFGLLLLLFLGFFRLDLVYEWIGDLGW